MQATKQRLAKPLRVHQLWDAISQHGPTTQAIDFEKLISVVTTANKIAQGKLVPTSELIG